MDPHQEMVAAMKGDEASPLVERLRTDVLWHQRRGNETIASDCQEAADTIQRMQEWLEGDCCCPCCTETRECVSGCTFAEDCPNEAEKMAGARVALYGA
jgi:hypothetical protein